MECKYNGCKEKSYENNYCILHMELPLDEESENFKLINSLKEKKVSEKIKNGDFNFEGAKLFEIRFINPNDKNSIECKENLNLKNSTIKTFVFFGSINIRFNVLMEGSKIGRNVQFTKYCVVEGEIFLDNSNIGIDVNFIGNENIKKNFKKGIYFKNAKIGGSISFRDLELLDDIILNSAKIQSNVKFKNCFIKKYLYIHPAEIGGTIVFDNTKFKIPFVQEYSCRKAKNSWEEFGDKEKADKYFFKEMEAKRLQKSAHFRYPEWLIQFFFGYGVYPLRVVLTWLGLIMAFSFIFWIGNGMGGGYSYLESFYSSVVTAATPGYGGFNPQGNYKLAASIEAIFGTFLWAAIIATFSRKYMR
jgi:hypothetical protein